MVIAVIAISPECHYPSPDKTSHNPPRQQWRTSPAAGNTSGQLTWKCAMTHTRETGRFAEDRVAALLGQSGWRLLDRNWRCRWGELDLLMSKPGRLLLVEVKARRQAGFDAWGAASLDDRKRRCLKRTFTCWLSQHADYQPYPVRMVLALVRLPVSAGQVRWINILETSLLRQDR